MQRLSGFGAIALLLICGYPHVFEVVDKIEPPFSLVDYYLTDLNQIDDQACKQVAHLDGKILELGSRTYDNDGSSI